MSIRTRLVTIRHWFPIITFCPVNHLPDFVYVSVAFLGQEDNELYSVRRRVRRIVKHRKCFMERLAEDVADEFPNAYSVTVRLAFNRHEVIVYNRSY